MSKYLNFLRTRYLESLGADRYLYLIGMLEPLVDESITRKALSSGAFKKLRLKCSDVNVDGIVSSDNNTIGSVVEIVGKQSGVVVEVTISVKGRKPSKILNARDIEESAQRFLGFMNDDSVPAVMKKDADMEVTYYDATMNASEAVNLLLPKVNFFVKIEAEERKPIDAMYLYHRVKEVYDRYAERLRSIVGEENVEEAN